MSEEVTLTKYCQKNIVLERVGNKFEHVLYRVAESIFIRPIDGLDLKDSFLARL